MSEIEADLDRAAASYWISVANKASTGKVPALSRAGDLLRDARAESRIADSQKQPTLNDLEAPQLDIVQRRRLSKMEVGGR
jgi:uncharacterized FAD-dependent dehydrogenase